MDKNKKYHLFLDDIRNPADVLLYNPRERVYADFEWVVVRNYDEFVKTILEQGIPKMISFDHDLADEHYDQKLSYDIYTEKTGYHCAKWLIDYCIDNKKELPDLIFVHSWNIGGAKNIVSLFDSYYKIYGK
jgi:hypothetical protein